VLSTEGVLYKDTAAATQAFSELQSVAAKCPAGPVTSPVGEDTVASKLTPTGSDWPQTDGITRLAWNVHASYSTGDTVDQTAVYLRRGRVLLGLYFSSQSASQPTIAGANTMQGIVKVFADRLAALPASVTGS
jgi:hypothetical protein